MKGMIFTMLSDLVEAEFGIETWDDLIDETNPASNGIYTSVDVYPDSELLAYVTLLSKKSGVPANDLVHAFGKFVLRKFYEMHPEFFSNHTAKTFLQSVHDVIHVEVKKLHPDVVLPDFEYEDVAENVLVMHYHSPRQLCHLAEGLIEEASAKFNVDIDIDHSTCTHDGANHCELRLEFGSVRAAA